MSAILCTGRLTRVLALRASSVIVPKAKLCVHTRVFKIAMSSSSPGLSANAMMFRRNFTATTIPEANITTDSVHKASLVLTDDGTTYVGEFLGDKRHGQGILKFKNGQVLEGEFRDGRFYNGKCTLLANDDSPTGLSFSGAMSLERDEAGTEDSPELASSDAHLKAARTSPIGRIYEGEFVNGSLHGAGRVTHADGRVMSGEFKNGHLWLGVGSKNLGDGRFYQGHFKYGRPFGQGRITNVDGSILEGEFKVGARIWQGTGVKRLSNGTAFHGTWRKGKMNGEGKIEHASGGMWVGEFLYNREHNGYGKVELWDGRVYEGMMVEGKRHGEGKLIDQGAVQEGEFKYGFFRVGSQRPVEKTDFYRPNRPIPVSRSLERKGVVYEGERVNGKPHGVGIVKFKNAQSWEGTFKDGAMYTGEGYVELEDGRTYEGEWLEGYMHGNGKLFFNGNLCWEGEFMLGQKLPNGPTHLDDARKQQLRAAKFKKGQFKPKKKRVWIDNKYKDGY